MKINPIMPNHSCINAHKGFKGGSQIKYALLGVATVLTGCVFSPSTQNVQEPIRTENVSVVQSKNTIENKHLKALKFVFEDSYNRKGVAVSLDNGFVKIVVPSGSKFVGAEYLTYNIKTTESGHQLEFNRLRSHYPGETWFDRFIEIINIEPSEDNNNFNITTCRRVTKTVRDNTGELYKNVYRSFEFDKYGNIITDAQRYQDRQLKIEKDLNNIQFFANNDTKMLSSILASMNISSVDAIEQDNGIELFGNSSDAAYYFVLKKGKDNSLYGIVNKMPVNITPQTTENDASTEIYAFKCSDKSTETVQRMIVTKMRVVQNDIDNQENNTQKFGERTNEHRVVNDYKTTHGFLGGAAIMATDENTFTTRYLSEGAISTLYVIDQDGNINQNGRNMYEI